MDTRRANSKYYNPQSFDPSTMDYQNDVRLAVRDELPTDINAEDMSESVYQQLFQTELVWPPLFFSGWAAFEPDVSSIQSLQDLTLTMLLFPVCSTSSTTHGRRVLSLQCSEESTP